MYTNHLSIRDYQITNVLQYINPSKKCITNVINRVVKCAPLITAFLTIGTLFSLIQEVSTRYIPHDEIARTSTAVIVPDDVKIVPIDEAVWLHVVKSPQPLIPKRCTWSNFFCSRPL